MIMSENTVLKKHLCCAKNSFSCYTGGVQRYFLQVMTAVGGLIVPSTTVVGCLWGATNYLPQYFITGLLSWRSCYCFHFEGFSKQLVQCCTFFFFLEESWSSSENEKKHQNYRSCLQWPLMIFSFALFYLRNVTCLHPILFKSTPFCVFWIWEQATQSRLPCPGSVSRSVCLSTLWTDSLWLSACDVSQQVRCIMFN